MLCRPGITTTDRVSRNRFRNEVVVLVFEDTAARTRMPQSYDILTLAGRLAHQYGFTPNEPRPHQPTRPVLFSCVFSYLNRAYPSSSALSSSAPWACFEDIALDRS